MKVSPEEPMELYCTYLMGRGRNVAFDILVDDVKAATVEPTGQMRRGLREETIPLDQELTKGKEKIVVKFKAHPGMRTAFISVCKTMKQK